MKKFLLPVSLDLRNCASKHGRAQRLIRSEVYGKQQLILFVCKR